jgi:hypothetical protein
VIRLAFYVLAFVLIWMVVRAAADVVRPRLSARRRATRPARPGGHDWEPRTRQLSRALKKVPVPVEDREGVRAWIDGHRGVEAYVEPKTVMSPLTVVLVDDAGEWKRFELADDSFLRTLAGERGLPVYDATRVGYPERMRRRTKRPHDPF